MKGEIMIKINVKGVIVPNDNAWIYKWLEMDCCCPKDIEAGLCEAAGEDICIEINSFGGACAAAFEIYTALKQYQGKVIANIIVACSAATIIACGASGAYASRASIFMIHNSQSGASGDYRDLQMGADALREVNESIINVYEAKTGLTREEIQKLMDNDTYMSPKKAIEKGFINGMMPGMEAETGTENETVINAVACLPGIFNSFANAIPADKALMLKEVIMNCSNTVNKNQKGENKMTLQEAMEKHPELKGELDTMLKTAEERGITGERKRLEELDAIAESVAQEALNSAKYGDNPLDAKEFAYQAMLADKVRMSAYMSDATSDTDASGVNNVGIMPENGEAGNEADELAAYANQRKEVK